MFILHGFLSLKIFGNYIKIYEKIKLIALGLKKILIYFSKLTQHCTLVHVFLIVIFFNAEINLRSIAFLLKEI